MLCRAKIERILKSNAPPHPEFSEETMNRRGTKEETETVGMHHKPLRANCGELGLVKSSFRTGNNFVRQVSLYDLRFLILSQWILEDLV